MKRIGVILAIAILMLSGSACSQLPDEPDSMESELSEIFEMGVDACGLESDFHHGNIVQSTPNRSVEDIEHKEITLKIGQQEEAFVYLDTLYYPVGERTVSRFCAKEDAERTVLIGQDGKINAILYPFATIEIAKTASPEAVRALLEPNLQELFDLSDYPNVDLPSAPDAGSDGFGIYQFSYYHAVDGYITNYVTVAVSDDGNIFGLKIIRNVPDGITLNIDKTLETELLTRKLNDIYSTGHSSLCSYRVELTPQIVTYNGELCVQYPVVAVYRHDTLGEGTSFLNDLLIPVRLLTA